MKPRRIMTAAEVAEHLHLHVGTVCKMARTGQIPAFKIGADWRFYNDEIEKPTCVVPLRHAVALALVGWY